MKGRVWPLPEPYDPATDYADAVKVSCGWCGAAPGTGCVHPTPLPSGRPRGCYPHEVRLGAGRLIRWAEAGSRAAVELTAAGSTASEREAAARRLVAAWSILAGAGVLPGSEARR